MRPVMRPLITILVLMLLIISINGNSKEITQITANDVSVDSSPQKIQEKNIDVTQVTSIVYDGVVSTGEYAISSTIGTNFDLYYSTDATTIYIAIVATAAGYVSIGFGSSVMVGSDIIIGFFNGATNIQDSFASGYSVTADATQNIISSAAGEVGGITTLEFSRLLDTGDATEDSVITIGAVTDIIWAYGAADDFISYHSARGSTTVTFTGPPSAPQNLAATALNAQVDLTWTAPTSDGGSAVQSYNIYRSTTSGSGYALVGSSNTLSYSDTTVSNGQTYYYIVRAVNSMGEGSDSGEVSATPTQSIPGPQNLIAQNGTSQVSLSWQPPATDGGSPITHYNIYRSTTSGSGYVKIGQNTTALGYVDTDVINANWYYYVVTAVNANTESAYSAEASAYPTGPPAAPTDIVAVVGSGNVTLNWTAPISDGGFPVNNYTIFRSDFTGGPYAKVGLNNSVLGYFDNTVIDGETYFYVITANNTVGGSSFSVEKRVTLKNVPFASPGLNLTLLFNETTSLFSVYLNWSASDPNGNPMLHYNIYRSEVEGQVGAFIGNSTNGSTLNYTDLTTSSGTLYYYIIAGVNTQGEGEYSSQVSINVGAVPGAPQNVKLTAGDGKITVRWAGVLEDGGFVVQKYHVYLATSINGPYNYSVTTPLKTATLTGLTNGFIYYVKIVAENVKGNGTLSTVVSTKPGTAPKEVGDLQIDGTDGVISLNWSQPVDNGGYSVFEYRVFWSTKSNSSYTFIGKNTTGLGFETSDGIIGVTYYFVIRSVNIMGESGFSSEINVSLSEVPSQPLNLTGVGGDKQVLLKWNSSEQSGGTPIIQYHVYRSTSSGSDYIKITSVIGNLTYVDTGLTNNVTYFYVVVSENIVGESDYSNEVAVEPYVATNEIQVTVSQTLTVTNTTSSTPLITTSGTEVTSTTDAGGDDPNIGLGGRSKQFFTTVGYFFSFAMVGFTVRLLKKPSEPQS